MKPPRYIYYWKIMHFQPSLKNVCITRSSDQIVQNVLVCIETPLPPNEVAAYLHSPLVHGILSIFIFGLKLVLLKN
jgi:hypothetical protein